MIPGRAFNYISTPVYYGCKKVGDLQAHQMLWFLINEYLPRPWVRTPVLPLRASEGFILSAHVVKIP